MDSSNKKVFMKELTAANLFDLENFRYKEIFHGLGYVWEALSLIETFLKKQSLGVVEGEVSSAAFLVDAHLISIGKGSVIEPGAYIKGPCIIGENCTIRHGAYIRGNVLVGDKCVVGHDSELKNVIMLNESHAPHFAYVGDSILGNRVNLGANLRFDKKNIVFHYKEKSFETGRHKFGAILGDDAQTGCNSVTNPGTIFEKKAFCFPTTNVGGYIEAKKQKD